jgi:hypothetical protein
LATNAGSLVGPGTTQPLITNSTTTAKKSNSISLSTYSGSIDPASSTGLTKYNNFVKSPYNDRIDCSVGNRNLILAALSEKAEQYSFAILRVPTSGSVRLAGAPLTINNITSANVDLNNYINILSKHTAKLTKEQLKAYSSWFFGAEDEALAPRATTSDMVACQVNLDAPGNQGLVAICKIQLHCESVMLYHFLVILLKTTEMTRFRMEQDEYTYV